MDRWVGKVAVVTGASSGVGLCIAEKLTEEGLKVVGVARRKENITALAAKLSSKRGKFFPYPADISKEEDTLSLFKWTSQNVGPVSILVNNAAMLSTFPTSKIETKELLDVLHLNIAATCIATREAIKIMKEHNIDGHIVNINSICGHKILGLPGLGVYSSSKYAVRAMTQSLRLELSAEGSKIKITSISPGAIQTEMFEKLLKISRPEQMESLKKAPCLTPDQVADAVAYVLATPKDVQISELTIQSVGENF